jgi:tyrosyl-tRNA synthetase
LSAFFSFRLHVTLILIPKKNQMQLFEELRWRGLVHTVSEGTEQYLHGQKSIGYVGFDPSAPSLGIGNLVPVMALVHFQRHGHTPIALVGGATGRIGDPSGKSAERNLQSENVVDENAARIEAQLRKLLDFDSGKNPARMVNNHDWFKHFHFLDFLRDVGKHITVNYMMAKDSVKNRIESETGISFTEFCYQLIQGYDFVHLYREQGCRVQFGGADQWGNITTGTTLIRKMLGHDSHAYAFTVPLITKADGTKFGKSEKGNIFIDPAMTSAFRFYQFWITSTDADIKTLAKIFSLRPIAELKGLVEMENPPARMLQTIMAEEMTIRIHGLEAFERAKSASDLLFGKGGQDILRTLTPADVEDVFEGVPSGEVTLDALNSGMNLIDFLVACGAYNSKGNARRAVVQDKSVKINLEKVSDPDMVIDASHVINGAFILIDKSKQSKHLALSV